MKISKEDVKKLIREEMSKLGVKPQNSTGRYGIKVLSVNPSLGNKRSTYTYKNQDGTAMRFDSEKEVNDFIENLKSKFNALDRTLYSYQIEKFLENNQSSKLPLKEEPLHVTSAAAGLVGDENKGPSEEWTDKAQCISMSEDTSMERRNRRWNDFKQKHKCSHCNGVKLVKPCSYCGGKGYIKPTPSKSLDEIQLDEKTPPGFPKPLYKKLKHQYKAEPEKAYATMWKLHKKYGDKLEETVDEIEDKLSNPHMEDDQVKDYDSFVLWFKDNFPNSNVPSLDSVKNQISLHGSRSYDDKNNVWVSVAGPHHPTPGARLEFTWPMAAKSYSNMYRDFAQYGTN